MAEKELRPIAVVSKSGNSGGLADLIKRTAAEKMGPEDTVLVWPNLVYIEFISILVTTTLLLLPTKAPWYFLGLQELLVYFDPWLAGVVLPSMIVVGLVLIPYIDPNPLGKGYYTFSERKFAVTGFIFGLGLWYVLILIGVEFRGLDWSWYWPWDDPHFHKPAGAVKLVDMEVIFQNALGLSENPLVKLGRYGITLANLLTWVLFVGYFVVGITIPFLFLRDFYNRLGFVRYNLTMFLLLAMLGVPLKIYLRLLANIKYVLVTPWFKI
jgi:hypothetical protein